MKAEPYLEKRGEQRRKVELTLYQVIKTKPRASGDYDQIRCDWSKDRRKQPTVYIK